MLSSHRASLATPQNALNDLLYCFRKLARSNYTRIFLCALFWVIGPAGLSVARSEPGGRGNANGHAKNSIGNNGLKKGHEKVHSVPETINSGVTVGVLVLLGTAAVLVRRLPAKGETRQQDSPRK
jgi:hypothetical protein